MRTWPLMLTLLASGCVAGSLDGYCQASASSMARLAAALVDDSHDAAVVAGQAVIAERDAACGQ